MKFIYVLGLVASTGMLEVAARDVCRGLYGSAQCCGGDLLGVLGLDCSSPRKVPKDGRDLKKICSQNGKSAKCCAVPLAGQGLLCQPPVGGT